MRIAAVRSVFAARLEPITFELKDFTTGVAGGLFTFTGASKLGERIEWHGHLSVQPVASDGELHIEGAASAHALGVSRGSAQFCRGVGRHRRAVDL